MTRYMVRVIAVMVFAISVAGAQRDGEASREALAASLQREFAALVGPNARVAAIAVLDGERVWAEARGLVNPEGGHETLTTEHLFDLGSVTKSITACAILRLAEQRKLELDDSIAKHLRSVPMSTEAVTVRHLLGHTAGLPLAADLSTAALEDSHRAAGELMALCVTTVPPGQVFSYSNCGYQVLAALVQEVSRQPFEQFVQRELFERAKLPTATLVGGEAPEPATRTRRVTPLKSSWIEEFPSGFGRKGTTGALMSAEDLVRWDAALRAGEVLQPESLRLMQAEGPGGYGLGWFVSPDGSRGLRMSHSGSVEGYKACFLRWPERQACLVVLGDGSVDAADIAAALEPLFPRTPSEPNVARMGAVESAFNQEDGTATLHSHREWHWSTGKDQLHAFLPREQPGDQPPVSAYLDIDEEPARQWLRDLRAALSKLERKSPRHHTLRIRVETRSGVWGSAEHLLPFVDDSRTDRVRFGLKRAQRAPALEIDMDAASLEPFLEVLAAQLP